MQVDLCNLPLKCFPIGLHIVPYIGIGHHIYNTRIPTVNIVGVYRCPKNSKFLLIFNDKLYLVKHTLLISSINIHTNFDKLIQIIFVKLQFRN